MNHIYRLVWNRALRLWQPVSELAAQTRGGAASALVCAPPARWRLNALAALLGLAFAGGWSSAAQAACATVATDTVECEGTASPLMPSYTDGANDLSVTVKSGASVGVPLAAGGVAMTLTGTNLQVTNNGLISPEALGSGIAVMSSGLVMGDVGAASAAPTTYAFTNNGVLYGSRQAYARDVADLKGMALTVRNGVNGVSTLTNTGTIATADLSAGNRPAGDAAAVAVYGGGQVNFFNSGTIYGRVAFEASGSAQGHAFTNLGTINGSVSLGAGGGNTFTAESGSSVKSVSGANATPIGVAGMPNLSFATPGTVYGGGQGNNQLVLADTYGSGAVTDISAATYVNFNSLTVNGGTWNLTGGAFVPSNGSVALKGGQVNVDDGRGLGQTRVSAAGGALGASTANLFISNTFDLGVGGLTTAGGNAFTLAGMLTGSGGLNVTGSGAVTLSGLNNYTGGTRIAGGATLQGFPGSLTGDIENDGALNFASAASGTFGGVISGTGSLSMLGTGTVTLTGANTYTGPTTINSGTLAIGAGGSLFSNSEVLLMTSGSTFDISAAGSQAIGQLRGSGKVELGSGRLIVAGAGGNNTFGGVIAGTGGLTKSGASTLILTGANTFSGGVEVQGGTLSVAAGGSLVNSTQLTVNTGGTFDLSGGSNMALAGLGGNGGRVNLGANVLTLAGGAYDGEIMGTGTVVKDSQGTLTLNGVNRYSGGTLVYGGKLMVGGTAADAAASVTGAVSVANGGAVGGFGQINGDLRVQAGGRLATGDPGGTFTVNGNMTLEQGSATDFSLGPPGSSHSVQVNGDLGLHGAQLNTIDAGGFGFGLYNLFNYTGSLTTSNSGLLGIQPGQTVQILTVTKQINLINTGVMTLNFWNANRLASPTQMGGGSGVWSVTNPVWTDDVGSVTASRQPADAFAIFGGAAGTVTVDAASGSVATKGMQFASNGYRLNGDALNLVAPSAGALSEVRVGDGSLASAAWTTTIDNVLAGDGFNKTGLGTLVLNGANTYTKSTRLSAGALSVAADANLGAASAGLDFQGGTLQVTGTAFQNTARQITLGAAGAGLDIADAANTFTLSQSLSGNGGLTKLGAGTLVLTGANTYLGTTSVRAGRLQVGDGATSGSFTGDAEVQAGATLAFNRGDRVVYGGVLSGSGQLRQEGAGTLVLTGQNVFNGTTTIASGVLQVGDGGATGTLGGTVVNNGSLVFNRATDSVFAGAVSGNGSLTKSGAGTLMLTGQNTLAGLTTVAAGALLVGDGVTSGSITGNAEVQAGGTLAFYRSDRVVYGGVLSGSGQLRQEGTGTLVLTGQNVFDGTTTIASGALQVGDGGATGTLGGNVVNNGSLVFNRATDSIAAGAISGAGTLTKLGAGTLALTGQNTYAGGTTIAAGTLQVGKGATAGSIAGNAEVQAGGTLAFNRSDRVVYDGVLSGAGQLRQEGTGTLVLTGQNTFTGVSTIASGVLQVGDGGVSGALNGNVVNHGSLAFNLAADRLYAGAISGDGVLAKQGAGVLQLTGDSSGYAGATQLSAGVLQVDGKLGGSLQAASGAMLSGVGTLNNVTLASGATLAPGNAQTPIGQLNVLGDLNFAPGSSYRVVAAADGRHSNVNVGGSANLAGSVLHLGQNGLYAPSTTYAIVTAGGGVQGRFDSVSSNLAFLTPTLAYDAQRVDLIVKLKEVPGGEGGPRPIRFADAANTANQRAVANALQSLQSDSGLYRRVLNLPEGAPARTFDSLSGEIHATSISALQGVAGNFVQTPMARMRANLAAGATPGAATAQLGLGDAAALPRSAAQPLWAQAFGNWTTLGGDGNAAKTKQSDSGISLGGDLAVGSGWRLGGALGYAGSRSSVAERASSSQADSYSLAVYGGKAFDAGAAKINLSLGAAYTWHDIKTQRQADAAGSAQTLKADYNGNTAQVFTELGYAWPLNGSLTLEPFVGAGFSSLRTDAFKESGGDAALRGDAGRNNVTTTTLGLHARAAFESAGAQGQVRGTLGWRHAFGDVNPASTLSFVQGGQSFTANGVPLARDAAVLELGVDMAVSKRTTVGVGYGGQFGGGNQQNYGTLDVRYRF